MAQLREISYFPGCSLATSAKESNLALKAVCRRMGYRLVELDDWNCCGSSSAHSIDKDLAFHLAARNLSLAPPGTPLLAACPSCILRLRQAHNRLKKDADARRDYRRRWGRPADPDLRIMHFFELFDDTVPRIMEKNLNGLHFVPYYGCMLARPPELRREKNYHGLMENLLTSCGGVSVDWQFASSCCGTFLSVAKPAVVVPMVNRIMQGAVDAGADCLVTACAMCHLNIEIRCTHKNPLPIFHFSELLALAFDIAPVPGRFSRHLIDPVPLLEKKGLVNHHA